MSQLCGQDLKWRALERYAPGNSNFAFDFQMRYRIEAMSAPSLIYDYYNPEANAAVAPVLFNVH